jgi:hypothetical protein
VTRPTPERPQLLGKVTVRGCLNAVVPGSLVYVTDQNSNRGFLVDTRASFSIFPHCSAAPATGLLVSGPAGRSIPCWDEKKLDLSFHGRHFLWMFLLAAVQFPFLGVDFLRPLNLVVDPAADRLVDQTTLVPVGVPSPSGSATGTGGVHSTISPLCSSSPSSAGPSIKVPSESLGLALQVAICSPSFSVSLPSTRQTVCCDNLLL